MCVQGLNVLRVFVDPVETKQCSTLKSFCCRLNKYLIFDGNVCSLVGGSYSYIYIHIGLAKRFIFYVRIRIQILFSNFCSCCRVLAVKYCVMYDDSVENSLKQ